jgi:hypothetical protein
MRACVVPLLAILAACAPPPGVVAPAASDPTALPAGALVDEAPLLAARDDRAALRRHAWALWAALGQLRDGVPVWERWTRADLAFAPRAAPPSARDRLGARFKPPRQFDPDDDVAIAPGLAAILFNPPAAAHLRAHALYDRAALARARAGAMARPGVHAIPPFPRDAIALKVIWFPVHHQGLTALPVWDGVAANPDDRHNSPSTWPRLVAIDPRRREVPAGETATVVIGARTVTARVVPLTRFYARRLASDDEVASARAAAHDPTLTRADYVALVAMHVSTKEVPDWTWATFWWHDAPDAAPDGDDRPADVRGAFRNYRMDTVARADDPAAGSTSCFNPWIEGRFAGGLRSSCVTCHQRAVALADDFLPVTHGPTPPAALAGELTVDFLWSIAFEPR